MAATPCASSFPRAQMPDHGADRMLDGLRQFREDCLRVSEYSNNLTVELDRRRKMHQEEMFAQRRQQWFACIESKISKVLTKAASRVIVFVCRGWAICGRRSAVIRAQDSTEVVRLMQMKNITRWRREVVLRRCNRAGENHKKHIEEAKRKWDAKLHELQEKLFMLKETSCRQMLKHMLQASNGECVFDTFHAWSRERDSTKAKQEKQACLIRSVAQMFMLETHGWLVETFGHWVTFGKQNKGKDVHTKMLERQSRSIMAKMLNAESSMLLQTVFQGWHLVFEEANEEREELESLQQYEEELHQARSSVVQAKTQMLKKCSALMMGKVDVSIHFDGWANLCLHAHINEQENSLKNRGQHLRSWDRHCEGAYKDWQIRYERNLLEVSVRICFADWRRIYGASVRERRKLAESKAKFLCQELQSAHKHSHDLSLKRVINPFVAHLGKFVSANLRHALQRWSEDASVGRMNPNRSMAFQVLRDVKVARLELVRSVSGKTFLQQKLADEHDLIVKRRRILRDCMASWADIWSCENALDVIFGWRLGAGINKIERTESWNESQRWRASETIQSQSSMKSEAHKMQAMKTFVQHHASNSTCAVFRKWHQVVVEERRAREYADIKASLESKIEKEKLNYDAKWKCSKNQRNERMAAATLRRALADQDQLLSIKFWDWRNLVVSRKERMKSVMRMRGMERARQVFDPLPWIIVACISIWRVSTRTPKAISRWEVSAEEIWLETLRGQVFSRLVNGMTESLKLGLRRRVLIGTVVAWKKTIQCVKMHTMAKEMQQASEKEAARAQDKIAKMSEDQAKFSAVADGQMNRQRWVKELQSIFKLWRTEVRFQRIDRDLASRDALVQQMPSTQHRFEEVVVERWMQRALAMRDRERNQRTAMCIFGVWRSAAPVLRTARRRGRGRIRAFWVGEVTDLRRRREVLLLSLSGWLDASNNARRKWLEKRCRCLEEALSSASGAGATARTNASWKENRGGRVLGWALEPLKGLAGSPASRNSPRQGGAHGGKIGICEIGASFGSSSSSSALGGNKKQSRSNETLEPTKLAIENVQRKPCELLPVPLPGGFPATANAQTLQVGGKNTALPVRKEETGRFGCASGRDMAEAVPRLGSPFSLPGAGTHPPWLHTTSANDAGRDPRKLHATQPKPACMTGKHPPAQIPDPRAIAFKAPLPPSGLAFGKSLNLDIQHTALPSEPIQRSGRVSSGACTQGVEQDFIARLQSFNFGLQSRTQ